MNRFAYHIHANAASGDIRDGRCGRKSRRKDQSFDFSARQRFVGTDQVLFDCALADFFCIQPLSVILDSQCQLRALVDRFDHQR